MRSKSSGAGEISPRRGHEAASPALHQGVAVAMDASRARQAPNCCSQPGSGCASGASTTTSTPAQALSISSRCATSPIMAWRRV